MPGRPGTLPWDFSTFTGLEPITTMSDNFGFLNNQINDSGAGFTSYAPDTGTANNLVVTLPSAPVAYEAGMMICTLPAFTSTGACVINVNSLGNVSIVNPGNQALSSNEISKNSLLTLIYDGTSFRIIGFCTKSFTVSTSATNITVPCDGATSVLVNVAFSGTAMGIALTHLSSGVPVLATYTNSGGVSRTISMSATTPGGGPYVISDIAAGSANGTGINNLVSTGITLAAGSAMMFTGMSYFGGQLLLSR